MVCNKKIRMVSSKNTKINAQYFTFENSLAQTFGVFKMQNIIFIKIDLNLTLANSPLEL